MSSEIFLQQLKDAKLAGSKTQDGYHFNDNDTAAEIARKVAVTWFRNEGLKLIDKYYGGDYSVGAVKSVVFEVFWNISNEMTRDA